MYTGIYIIYISCYACLTRRGTLNTSRACSTGEEHRFLVHVGLECHRRVGGWGLLVPVLRLPFLGHHGEGGRPSTGVAMNIVLLATAVRAYSSVCFLAGDGCYREGRQSTGVAVKKCVAWYRRCVLFWNRRGRLLPHTPGL